MIVTPRNLVGATVRLTTQVLQPVNTSRICTVSHALDCSFVSQVVGGCCASFGIQTEPWKMSERDSNSRSLGTLEPQARICEKERNAQGFVTPVLRAKATLRLVPVSLQGSEDQLSIMWKVMAILVTAIQDCKA
ncbi:hypothetical protein BofuT4_P133530.1 [Botrytis cinerea T4]|uniref:Uncharacterized protein n=1 Tax=Botryotinia fuckeliana (strain T4) TaxID=999810 RepID=G2YQA1_BOTF4|nr:hypothetical protein BofuT4_P133530.1 [Botrytis cinerea T4]